LFIYDSDRWTQGANLPEVNGALTANFINGILFVGGVNSKDTLKSTLAYDPASDEWTVLEPKPSKRGRLSSAVVNGSIYVFRGERPNWTFNNNEKYHTTTNKWTSEESMSTARHGLADVSFTDNKIYVIGGGPQPDDSGTNINELFHGDDSRR